MVASVKKIVFEEARDIGGRDGTVGNAPETGGDFEHGL